MYGAEEQFGQWLTLLLIAFALGMDAFSLGIGVGVRVAGRRQVFEMSALTGLFHLLMPLVGLFFGGIIQRLVGPYALFGSGLLISVLGLHMALQAWRESQQMEISANANAVVTFWTMLVFAFSVSVDSLSIGFSLGMVGVDVWLALTLFAVTASLMCGLGLSLGKAIHRYIGRYGELAGGIILLVLGLKFIYMGLF